MKLNEAIAVISYLSRNNIVEWNKDVAREALSVIDATAEKVFKERYTKDEDQLFMFSDYEQ